MRLSIRLKLILPLVLGLGLIAVATAGLMRLVHERAIDQAALSELEHAAAALAAQEESEVDRLLALAEAISGDESLGRLLLRRDREGLLAEARPMFQRLRDAHGVTHWYFHPAAADGVLLRVHRPELFGDRIHRPTLLKAVETGGPASGVEFGRTAYAVRVVRPWRLDGQVIGYLELGSDIHTFLGRLKRVTGDDYGMLLDKRKLELAAWGAVTGHPERWDDRPELVAITSTTGDERIFGALGRAAELPAAPALLGRTRQGELVVARGAFPLRGAEGEVVGGVVVLHDITPLLGGVAELRLRVVILVVLLAAGLAALVIFLLDTLVFDRVDRMSRTLEGLPERLARGDLEPDHLAPRPEDELGRVETFLDQALAAVGAFVAEARRPRPEGGALHRSERDDR